MAIGRNIVMSWLSTKDMVAILRAIEDKMEKTKAQLHYHTGMSTEGEPEKLKENIWGRRYLRLTKISEGLRSQIKNKNKKVRSL